MKRYWITVSKLAIWAIGIFSAMGVIYCLIGGVLGFRHIAECWGEFTTGTDWVPTFGGSEDERYGDSWRLFFAAFLVRLCGLIFFGGVFISALTNLFLNVSEDRTRGIFRYRQRFLKNHFIIVGSGEETESVIRSIFSGDFGEYSGERIVILTHSDVETARERLFSGLAHYKKMLGSILFYYGDLDTRECFVDLAPWRAREIFVLGDADDFAGRDVRNMSAIHFFDEIIAEHKALKIGDARIPVNVQICSVSTYSAIQKLDNFDRNDDSSFPHVAPRVFNFYENWARSLWGFFGMREDGNAADRYFYRDLDYLPIRSEDDAHHVHLVVVGLNQMGLALVLEALRICHYANFNEAADGPKTRITIIDRDPERELFFRAAYPEIEKIYDIDVDFICAPVESPEARNKIAASAKDPLCLLTVAVCLSDDDASLATGLSLPDCVFEHRDEDHPEMKRGGNTVLIRQAQRSEISRKLDRDENRYKFVRRFGYANPRFEPEFLRDDMPKFVNILYEKWHLIEEISDDEMEQLKREMHLAWLELEEYKRWSNRFQVDSYRVYLRLFGIRATKDSSGTNAAISAACGDELLVDMEHRRWLAERYLSGTRFYNKPFPPDNRTTEQDKTYRLHNCIQKTSGLPKGVRMKDLEPLVNMPKMLKREGYEFYGIEDELE